MVHFVTNLRIKLMKRYFFLTVMKLKIKIYLITRIRLQNFWLITMGFIILWANNFEVDKNTKIVSVPVKVYFSYNHTNKC